MGNYAVSIMCNLARSYCLGQLRHRCHKESGFIYYGYYDGAANFIFLFNVPRFFYRVLVNLLQYWSGKELYDQQNTDLDQVISSTASAKVAHNDRGATKHQLQRIWLQHQKPSLDFMKQKFSHKRMDHLPASYCRHSHRHLQCLCVCTRAWMWARTHVEKLDTPHFYSGRPITHKFNSRLRCQRTHCIM
jgi:hypothetical protein